MVESGLLEGKSPSWSEGLQYELYYWLDRLSHQLASRDEDLGAAHIANREYREYRENEGNWEYRENMEYREKSGKNAI